MKFTLLALGFSTVSTVLAAPNLSARQTSCPAPTNASCKELHDRCVGLPASWLQNPWSQRVCVAAATCYGVGRLLTSGACRQNRAPPNPRTLPGLSDAVFANFRTCSGCPISRQNYIDFIYGTIQSAWPSSAQVVIQWWSDISAWTAFPSQNVPRRNFNDWLLYSTTPTNPTGTTTTTPTNTPTPTVLPGNQQNCAHDVSISFDDGPFIYNRQIVNAFEGAQSKATFFVNGNNFDCIYNPDRVADLRYAYERGHVIASHTWSHVDITTISDAQLGADLDKLEAALWKIIGVKPALFRPPYGNFNQRNINYLNSRGYTIVTWNIDTGDSLGASVATSMNTVRSNARAGSMILAHETSQSTAQQLTPQMISHMQANNLKMITSNQCLNIPPYQAVGAYGNRDASWVC